MKIAEFARASQQGVVIRVTAAKVQASSRWMLSAMGWILTGTQRHIGLHLDPNWAPRYARCRGNRDATLR
ncbi:hypothetical protein [Streptomyces sp. Rer75]|uniref:hypothetical protein n=1 Tax=Streptomyces sp. Rer75 TaxID=2750011 RepID=UPI0015D0B007|nr:hypothetical protein [Streptomyces sp. Rer75]QLH21948.1 hypothetical protein HYQ63_16125 [Streptomyces sp. Rer75]